MVNTDRITDGVKRRDGAPYHRAMTFCPDAREFEFRWPLELARPLAGEIVVDFPSGGSYLRPYLDRIAPGAVLRPVEHVSGYLDRDPAILQGNWDRLPFANQEVQVVLTLAALHHVLFRRDAFYRECQRVLAPGGRLVIGDVAEGTRAAAFLDEFVNAYSSQGHEASFLSRDTDAACIEAAGFRVVHYEVTPFFWSYPDRDTAIRFCRDLFRLDSADEQQVWQGLQEYLGIEEGAHGVRMNWELAFVRADRQAG